MLACLHERREARERADVGRFFSTFTLERRRPEMAETARLEGSADLAMQVAVRATVLDLAGTASIGKLDAETRALWLLSVRNLSKESLAARELALRSIATRPAWAFGAEALAELVLAGESRESASERQGVNGGGNARWEIPLRVATAWAPAERRPWALWATAILAHWGTLTPEERSQGAPVLTTAFRDEEFLRQSLDDLLAIVGTRQGLALLTDTSAALARVRRAPVTKGDFPLGVELQRRWEAAERRERRLEIARIDELVSAGRTGRAAESARAFLQAHPVPLFDDGVGRAQAITILKALSDDQPGLWASEPRGALVRYFLDSPSRGATPGDLLHALTGLGGVPETLRARVLLLAGNTYGWQSLLADVESSETLHWTSFFVELTRQRLAQNDGPEAEAAVRRISRHSANECDVLLVRRDVARAREDAAELALLRGVWPVAFPETIAAGSGSIAVCVDPERDAARELTLTVSTSTAGSAYAYWGWDGGRAGTILLEGNGERTLRFPLKGLSGRRIFSLGTLVGSDVKVLTARISAEEVGSESSSRSGPPRF